MHFKRLFANQIGEILYASSYVKKVQFNYANVYFILIKNIEYKILIIPTQIIQESTIFH